MRNDHQAMVRDFMVTMGQPVPERITLDRYPFEPRMRRILEEAAEFVKACGYIALGKHEYKNDSDCVHCGAFGPTHDNTPCIQFERGWDSDLVKMIDALCNLKYAVEAGGNSMAVDLDPFFVEVHRSNMKKSYTELGQKPRIAKILEIEREVENKRFGPAVEPDRPEQGGARMLGTKESPDGNVIPIRRPAKIGKAESPENEQYSELTRAQLRQQLTDLNRQLGYLGGRIGQVKAENDILWARALQFETDAKKAQRLEFENKHLKGLCDSVGITFEEQPEPIKVEQPEPCPYHDQKLTNNPAKCTCIDGEIRKCTKERPDASADYHEGAEKLPGEPERMRCSDCAAEWRP